MLVAVADGRCSFVGALGIGLYPVLHAARGTVGSRHPAMPYPVLAENVRKNSHTRPEADGRLPEHGGQSGVAVATADDYRRTEGCLFTHRAWDWWQNDSAYEAVHRVGQVHLHNAAADEICDGTTAKNGGSGNR